MYDLGHFLNKNYFVLRIFLKDGSLQASFQGFPKVVRRLGKSPGNEFDISRNCGTTRTAFKSGCSNTEKQNHQSFLVNFMAW